MKTYKVMNKTCEDCVSYIEQTIWCGICAERECKANYDDKPCKRFVEKERN